MTNKYNEIKEALESEIHLVEYVDASYSENISLELLKDILDLVNSQQTEIEWLSQAHTNSLRLSTAILDTANRHYAELYKNNVRTARLDAVKTFVKRLKEKKQHSTIDNSLCTMAMIDETLKELEDKIK